MAAAGNGHQHDTVALGPPGGRQHDTLALPDPHLGYPPAMPASWGPSPGWGPSPSWSQVPPFLPSAGRPVVIARNNAAVVGATLGSVSLFLALMPLVGIVAWLLAPIGLLSSGVGLLVGMRRRVGRVGALWGLVTSGLALLICLVWVALVLGI